MTVRKERYKSLFAHILFSSNSASVSTVSCPLGTELMYCPVRVESLLVYLMDDPFMEKKKNVFFVYSESLIK